MAASTTSTRPCPLHGAAMAEYMWARCPACEAYRRGVHEALAQSAEGDYSSSQEPESAGSATTHTGSNRTMATPHNLTDRCNKLIATLGLANVPALAEALGVDRAGLYLALKQDREGTEVANTDVLAAIAKLEADAGTAGAAGSDEQADEQGAEDAGEGQQPEQEPAAEQAPAAPAKQTKGKGKQAKAPAAEKPAKQAKAPKAAKTAGRDAITATLPGKGEAIWTTAGNVDVVDEQGVTTRRSIGPLALSADGKRFAGRTRMKSRHFEVTSTDGKTWAVAGEWDRGVSLKAALAAAEGTAPEGGNAVTRQQRKQAASKAKAPAAAPAAAPASDVRPAPKGGKKTAKAGKK